MTNWSGRFEASDLFVIVGIAAARASKVLQRLTLEGDEQVGGFSPTSTEAQRVARQAS